MRNVIVLLVLAALLFAVNRLAQIVSDWHYVVPAQPGALLYAATFDDFLSDWSLYEGRLSAQVENSALRLDVDAADSLPYSTAAPYFADFDLRVQARPLDGPFNNGYGVIFRVQDPQNYYMFLVSSDGYYQVQRSVAGDQKVLSAWIPSPLVDQGFNVDNWLRVVAQGENFEFFINEQQVDLCVPYSVFGISTYRDTCIDGQMQPVLTDELIGQGQLGVVAQSFDEQGVVVAFDNLLVYGPE